MLGMFDTENKGILTDKEMQNIMTNTKLEKAVCAKIWQLSNPNLLTNFDVKMFTAAMHLLYRKRSD